MEKFRDSLFVRVAQKFLACFLQMIVSYFVEQKWKI